MDKTQDRTFSTPEWMNAALDDLQSPEAGGLREFLREYGADVNDPRSAYASLVSVYDRVFLHPVKDWGETLRAVGEMFMNPSDAIRLKQWLTTPREIAERPFELDRNLATATYLLTSDNSKPYEDATLDFERLASGLWLSGKRQVLSLLGQLIRREERPSANAFVTAIAKAVQPAELKLIFEERPELLQLILSQNPTLAFHTEIWKLPGQAQWRISEALHALDLDSKDWGNIVGAMLIAGTNVGVRDAVNKAGSSAIDGMLCWLESTAIDQQLPSEAWREALAVPAEGQLRATESLLPSTLALCSLFLSAETIRKLLNHRRQDVRRLAAEPLEMLTPLLRVHVAFILVTLGLRAGGIEGAKLVANGFFPVYESLASSDYPPESWLLLAPELPSLGLWREWDRCKKLRLALRERFSEHKEFTIQTLIDFATTLDQRTLVRRVFK